MVRLTSLAAGFRPARNSVASQGLSLFRKPDSTFGSVFRFRRLLSPPTTTGNIRVRIATAAFFQVLPFWLSTAFRNPFEVKSLNSGETGGELDGGGKICAVENFNKAALFERLPETHVV